MSEIFPTIRGKNLNRKHTLIPDDFSDMNLIVIVAFQRWHQSIVDESLERLNQANMHASHHVLEIPVLKQFSKFRQMRLDGVMRAAISDEVIRQRTITVYLDKDTFRKSLNIPNEDTTYWFLIDCVTKDILLRGTGIVSSQDIGNIKLVYQ